MAERLAGSDVDTIKRFSSQTQAEFPIANTATEGKPVLLRVVLDDRVQTVREEWAVETQEGYLTV